MIPIKTNKITISRFRKFTTIPGVLTVLSLALSSSSFGSPREGWLGPVEESSTTTYKFDRHGKSFNSRAEYEFTLKSSTYNVYRRIVNKLVDIAYTESVQVESNGIGGNWQGAFDHSGIERATADKGLIKEHFYCPDVVTIREKADCLSRTFKGISFQQAQEMLEAGYFKTRIDSWYDFAATFKKFDEESRFSSNFLNKHGNVNLATFDLLNRSNPVRIAPVNEFYCPNVSNFSSLDDKADCLSRKFKGINFQQAYGMLQAGSFKTRVDDWNEFSLAIIEFDQAYPSVRIAYNVLNVHGDENLRTLDSVAISIRNRSYSPQIDYYCPNVITTNDKANCLSGKFRGITYNRAFEMLQAGYFKNRTTSWNEFTADIVEFEQKNPPASLAFSVTTLYSIHNSQTLDVLRHQSSEAKKELLKNAFIDEKANRLSRAILGFSFQQAHGMVQLGYFANQPTSWTEFGNEIERFAQSLPRAEISRTILDLYGQQNKRNLKFEITQINTKYRKEPRDIEERDTVLKCTHERKFKFILLDSLLDYNETDRFTLTLKGETPSVSINSIYNDYSAATPTVISAGRDGSPVTFEYVVNAKRKAFRPSNSLRAQVKEEHGFFNLSVTDTSFDGERAGTAEVSGKIIETGRFGKTKEIGTFSGMLSGKERHTLIKTDIRLTGKKSKKRWYHLHRTFGLWDWWHQKSVHVIYKLKRQGNPMYSNEASDEKTTDSVTL